MNSWRKSRRNSGRLFRRRNLVEITGENSEKKSWISYFCLEGISEKISSEHSGRLVGENPKGIRGVLENTFERMAEEYLEGFHGGILQGIPGAIALEIHGGISDRVSE